LFSCNLVFGSLYDAQKLYDKKLYQKTIDMAKSSVSDYPNPKLHILWAKSAEKLGKASEAMSAYERAIMLSPLNTSIQKSLLSIYIKTKRYKLAVNLSDELKSKNIDLSGFKIKSYDTSKSNIDASASLSYGYDTNYNIHHESSTLDDFYGTTNVPTKKASKFSQTILDIGYTKEFENDIYIRSKFNGYYKLVTDDTNYNVYLNNIEFGVGYYTNDYNIYVPISYYRLFYLKQDYLSVLSLSPRIDYKWNNNFILSLSTSFEKRTLFVDNDRNDRTVGIGTALYYSIEKNYLFVDLNYKVYKSTGALYQDFTDKKNFTMTIGAKHNFTPKVNLSASYKISLTEYIDSIGTTITPDNTIRSDTYSQINIRLSKQFTKNITLYIENEYSVNKSNFIPSDYDKNVLSVGINLNY